ncbi:WD40 repeat domain-containing protein [Pyxidicoccus xibeiensis]|uniref:WD40 repeat domain-containing protein n=1 Tax=Pyxidicoccus xibeiensis TaxID=2906759 RepID=UPI0020A71F83|nr:WD40 repeat domain-containing protein [Pyxidicoccus xibeiensis]MCP3142257.1 WD40 repeat domain-containing protein [Pyxidicoccus xibeiensis]
MNSRRLCLPSARSGRSRPFLALALALGLVSACSDSGGGNPPDPRTPGKARIEAVADRGAVGEPLRFRCTAEDPQGGRLMYSFDWGDGSGEETDSESVDSGVTAEVTRTFTREGSFQARCRALKDIGLAGEWSEPVGYTVQGTVPDDREHSVAVRVFGQGRVTSTPLGLDCSPDGSCVKVFPAGTLLSLRPRPEEGWRFVGWLGCEEGLEATLLTLDRDVACTARFAPAVDASVEWQRTGARLPKSPVWSADGTRLAAIDGGLALSNALLRIWDAESGRVVRLLSARPESFTSVAWHPSSSVLAAGRSNGSIVLIDATTGAIVRQWMALAGDVRALAWSPDGSRLASADDAGKLVRIWFADSGMPDGAPLEALDKVRRLAWSPDGSRLALEAGAAISATSQWVEIHALGTKGLEALWVDVASFTWSPDGQRYALGLHDEVRVYVTATHQPEKSLRGAWSTTASLDWSRDGRWIALGNTTRLVMVMDVAASVLVASYSEPSPPGAQKSFDGLRFHPSKPELAMVDDLPARVSVLTVDAAAGAVSVRELLAHDRDVGEVAWSPTGAMLASGGAEGLIRLWSRDGGALRTLSGHGNNAIKSLSWDRTGTRLASGGTDSRICIWRAEDGTLVREPLEHYAGQHPLMREVSLVALSPDGGRVAGVARAAQPTVRGGLVRVWDVATGQQLFQFTEADESMRSLSWTPDGRYLVATYIGASWSIWDSQTGELRFVDPGLSIASKASALSPDGTRIALGLESGLSIRDLSTGAVVLESSSGVDALALSWSPDGRRIAEGGMSGLVFTWDLDRAMTRSVIGFHDGVVSSVSWRPDGMALTTGGTDSSLVTWHSRH